MKRYLEKSYIKNLKKTVLETKKDKAIVIYLAFQPYVLPIVSMYN